MKPGSILIRAKINPTLDVAFGWGAVERNSTSCHDDEVAGKLIQGLSKRCSVSNDVMTGLFDLLQSAFKDVYGCEISVNAAVKLLFYSSLSKPQTAEYCHHLRPKWSLMQQYNGF